MLCQDLSSDIRSVYFQEWKTRIERRLCIGWIFIDDGIETLHGRTCEIVLANPVVASFA
jgi:hypothetical protein